ncbi:hypothetical protein HDU97_003474 [Phlyctochytrium planicorne]|nr:hypothetical protein HDU97_003474 [Phlyctochytrium planicorne]
MTEEKQLAVLCESFFENVEFDKGLENVRNDNRDGWVPIEFFANHRRLGQLANDDYVVAKAIRQNSKTLEVSDDGSMIRSRQMMARTGLDHKRMIYIENLPRESTTDSVIEMLSSIAEMETVYFPPPLINGEMFNANKRSCVYAFATCKTKQDALKVAKALGGFGALRKRAEPKGQSWPDQLERLRCLTVFEWQKRSKEYLELLESRSVHLKSVLDEGFEDHNLKFTCGLVCKFSNVHPKTTAKVLKHLFELVATVSFVDYKTGRTNGYVRFKTIHGAALSELFFSRDAVYQLHKDDYGSLKSKGLRAKWQNDASLSSYKPEKIELMRLKGEEEREYWNHIFELQKTQSKSSAPPPPPTTPKEKRQPYSNQKPSGSKILFNDDEEK